MRIVIAAEEVVKVLPMLLKEHPELRTELYGISSDEFVRMSEFYDYMMCKIKNEECVIFEIKSYTEEEDIERFNDKAELAIKKFGLKKEEKAMITLEKHPLVVELCDKLGILVG